jgi:hypothetical protein
MALLSPAIHEKHKHAHTRTLTYLFKQVGISVGGLFLCGWVPGGGGQSWAGNIQ